MALLDAFVKIDDDGDHNISVEEMCCGLVQFGRCVWEERVLRIVSDMSEN